MNWIAGRRSASGCGKPAGSGGGAGGGDGDGSSEVGEGLACDREAPEREHLALRLQGLPGPHRSVPRTITIPANEIAQTSERRYGTPMMYTGR